MFQVARPVAVVVEVVVAVPVALAFAAHPVVAVVFALVLLEFASLAALPVTVLA